MTLRRAGAPRLIDWTGERAVPWAPDVQVLYEHYHRYLWAQPLAAGRRVLDIGSGEGYGSALLAETARSVVGIDTDEPTVEHARLNYENGGLTFRVGSATALDGIEDGSVDLVVAFELIEHVDDQAALLAEARRVLQPDGLLLISTPERRIYTDAEGRTNPFHVRELSEPEFRDLLRTTFAHVTLFGQRVATGSRIESLQGELDGTSQAFAIEQDGDGWRPAGRMSPLYLVAVASAAELPQLPAASALSDFGLMLMREAEGRGNERVAQLTQGARVLEERLAEQHAAMDEATAFSAQLSALLQELGISDDAHGGLQALASESHENVRRIESLQREQLAHFDEIARWSRLYDTLQQTGDAERSALESRIQGQDLELRRVRESVTWKLFQRAQWKLYAALGGRGSVLSRALSASLRALGRMGAAASRADDPPADALAIVTPTVTLPEFAEPLVSIVIAAYDGAELTERCLRAILHTTDAVPYEVIVVDDHADEQTKQLLAGIRGVHVLTNKENLGYLRSVNRGSAAARGRYIVQLNNDTEPQPGWLESLVERAESADDIGIVVPKLLYPDGTLQEAGGIVWRDGHGWNFGRGDNARHSRYNFVREVDYGSAAALLVRRDLWEALGGFDERFVPGYYEDTDLCFGARDRGMRVLYEPAAHVVHVEGASMGTDPAVGGKAFQEVNRGTFVEKWAAALERQHPGPAPERVSLAADRSPGSHVLVIDHRVPTPDRDSGSLRMWHLLDNLVKLGHRVTFIPDNFQPTEPYTRDLQRRGIHVVYGAVDLPALLAGLAATLRLAIVSRPHVAPRYLHVLRELVPHVPIAYDTVDLHYVRERLRAELEGSGDMTKADAWRELELALVRSSDVSLTVSRAEAARLQIDAPESRVHVVPNANDLWDRVPGRAGRRGLLFVGGFEHRPNIDAAQYLVRRIMPLVWRRVPEAHVTIVGGDAPEEVLRLSAPNVDVTGWVADLDPLLRSSVALVAPLRYGAGVKGKVTQSLSVGLPVIATALGAEGLDAREGVDLLQADDPTAFAEQVVRLHGDDALWHELSANGQEVIRRLGSPEVQREALVQLLADVATR